MALQLGLGGHDQLQHFIASPAWDDAGRFGSDAITSGHG
jgi:hypothetical protein